LINVPSERKAVAQKPIPCTTANLLGQAKEVRGAHHHAEEKNSDQDCHALGNLLGQHFLLVWIF